MILLLKTAELIVQNNIGLTPETKFNINGLALGSRINNKTLGTLLNAVIDFYLLSYTNPEVKDTNQMTQIKVESVNLAKFIELGFDEKQLQVLLFGILFDKVSDNFKEILAQILKHMNLELESTN